jgi:hypothetical protein
MSHKKIEGAILIVFIKNVNSPYAVDGGCVPDAHDSFVCVDVLFQRISQTDIITMYKLLVRLFSTLGTVKHNTCKCNASFSSIRRSCRIMLTRSIAKGRDAVLQLVGKAHWGRARYKCDTCVASRDKDTSCLPAYRASVTNQHTCDTPAAGYHPL